MKNERQDFPPASLRTLQILDLYLNNPSSKTLKSISEQLDIPFTSLYRIVMCMQKNHYLMEDPMRPNHFCLGYKIAQLSEHMYSKRNLIKTSLPLMQKAASQLNQACQLCVLSDYGVCTIEQCLPSRAITFITELNETIPINVSASGKILTALLPQKDQERFLKKAITAFQKNTDRTITDPELIRSHLRLAARQGYGTDNEEYAVGIGCVAVPVFGSSDRPIAAIGATGPIEFYQNEGSFRQILTALQEASAEISAEMRLDT